MFLVFLNHFNVLMSKIIFKKSKKFIGMYFDTKNYLKNNRNYTVKQTLNRRSVLTIVDGEQERCDPLWC